MSLMYYLSPLNTIKEMFSSIYSYLKKDNQEANYSLIESLINSETSQEDILKNSKRISPEFLRPTEDERKDIERKIKEIKRQHTPGKYFQWDETVK